MPRPSSRLEPRPRIELGTSCLPCKRIYRLSYRGVSGDSTPKAAAEYLGLPSSVLGYQDSDLDCGGQNSAGCQLPHTPLEPAAGLEPATLRLQDGCSASDELGRRRVRDGT